VTKPASKSAFGIPVAAFDRTTIPVTVGRPWAGLPGKEVTHFSNA